MSDKIKLDIISDVVCPWCMISYNHLQAAIEDLNLQDRVEIKWLPFELNSEMPAEGEELRSHLARKYGSSKADSARTLATIKQAGADYGFDFEYFDEMKMVNTLDAHLLLDYAHQVGKQTKLKMRLFSAFFTEQKDISNRNVLLNEAAAIGISIEQSQVALVDDDIRNRVQTLKSQWQKMGISGVPTIIFNGKIALTGAQPQSTFKEVLLELIEQKK